MPLRPFTIEALARRVNGLAAGDGGALVTRVVTDTRAGLRGGDVFVALRGPRFDGERFAEAALAGGATAVLSTRAAPDTLPAGCAWIRVDDALSALQALARDARDAFGGTLVAITGSNGKTTVKEMIREAAGSDRRVWVAPMSWNSQVGVALTLLELDPEAELAILECGVSQPGEMARLAAMVRPDVGIFTNVGDAHLEGFGTRERTASEKAQLFGAARRVFVSTRDPLTGPAVASLGIEAVRVGPGADVWRVSEVPAWTLSGPGGETVRLGAAPTAGERNRELAAAFALSIGIEAERVEERLARWQPAPMRLEMAMTAGGVVVINDAYTADPLSFELALRTLVAERGGRSWAVLGGMAQLGEAQHRANRQVATRILEEGIDRLIGVGEGGAAIVEAALGLGMPTAACTRVADVHEAAAILSRDTLPGDRVLVKGSRPERLERVVEALFDSLSPGRLYVDLDAVGRNFASIRRAVGHEVAVMAVVKSFGYGLDEVRIGHALQAAGVDAFAVAYADEGVRLRERGIVRPILVQNLLPGETGKIVRGELAVELASREQLPILRQAARETGRAVRVHLKIDTGMGRSGLALDELDAVLPAFQERGELEVEGVMTHLAASDEPEHDGFTEAQLDRFDAALGKVRTAGLSPRWVHAANSGGIARFPRARYSMVRAGISLFGYGPPGLVAGWSQEPVLRLVTQVVLTREVRAGETVGYGRTWRASSDRRIAVVAVGYNDGYPRALSNAGWMSIAGVRCPVVGRVCMDVTMVDVTDVPVPVGPGDEVVVYGRGREEPGVPEMAEAAGTIAYELLTRLSPRLRRIYRAGSSANSRP